MELRPREREVLQAFVSGMSTDEVAEHLSISVHTVRAHLKNAMQTLGAHSKLEAIIRAGRAGLIMMYPRPNGPEGLGRPPAGVRLRAGSTELASSCSTVSPLTALGGWIMVERGAAGSVYDRFCPGMTCSLRLRETTQGALLLFHVFLDTGDHELLGHVAAHDRPAIHVLDWLSTHVTALHGCSHSADAMAREAGA